jgi:hypothetical protein
MVLLGPTAFPSTITVTSSMLPAGHYLVVSHKDNDKNWAEDRVLSNPVLNLYEVAEDGDPFHAL